MVEMYSLRPPRAQLTLVSGFLERRPEVGRPGAILDMERACVASYDSVTASASGGSQPFSVKTSTARRS